MRARTRHLRPLLILLAGAALCGDLSTARGGSIAEGLQAEGETRTLQLKPEANLPIMVRAASLPVQPMPGTGPARDVTEVKRMAREAAAAHAVPIDYFLRLIKQESGFNERAVSRAGAQGIAQFMPTTAAIRGLKNPFDPAEALPKSAAFLSELTRRFGNIGLAAAAYNGGPGRVANWLAGKGNLPLETRSYVLAITGRTVEDWAPPGTRLREAAAGLALLQGETSRRARIYKPKDWELELLHTLTAQSSTPQKSASQDLKLASHTLAANALRGRKGRPFSSRAAAEGALCPSCLIQSSY